MARKLSLPEFQELSKKYKVGPQNESQYFRREGGDIYYDPQDRALALEDEIGTKQKAYDTERGALEERLLGQIDLPSLFESAAKQANPNYGLSRPEILARFNDPKYSDTKSSQYVDPFTRTAIANRLKSGYQGVIGDAANRADAMLGKDITARQFALEKAGEGLTGAQSALADEYKSREDLAKEERDFQRQVALAQLRSSSTTGFDTDSQFQNDLAGARQAVDQGADPTSVISRMIGQYPKQRVAIESALKGAGFLSEPDEQGGYNFYGPGGVPVSVEQYASGRGVGLDEALAGSMNPQDIMTVKKIMEDKSKIDPLLSLFRGY